ncbi:MAG: hypothetical protein JNJ46_28825 [Myxococcales bacterium]|nr:hypothetical protein [Myxococcales bacterium]
MIQFPAEYTQHVGEHLVTAYPPKGGGRFRYWERMRPALSFSAVVERVLSTDPAFSVRSLGKPLRIVTKEGEYAAWVPVEGVREGGRARHYIGAVLLDEFVAVLDTVVLIPQQFDEFARLSEEYLRSIVLEQGARPRLFSYEPPPGWQGLPSGHTANWYPLDFPKNRSNIAVLPARVTKGDLEETKNALVTASSVDMQIDTSVEEAAQLGSGVTGCFVLLRGRGVKKPEPMLREFAVFVSEQRSYVLRLENMSADTADEARRIFRAVVASVRLLPQANERNVGRAFSDVPSSAGMWAD